MFNSKLSQLKTSKTTSVKASSSTNPFIKGAAVQTSVVASGNGAKKFSTTQNPLVDQFSMLGTYRTIRSFQDVSRDCEILWAHDSEQSVKFMFYLRIINRDIKLEGETLKHQKGGELKHESIMRFIWLAIRHPEVFEKNAHLIPAVGSWKDIFQMLSLDLQYNGWDERKLNWDFMLKLIVSGLSSEQEVNLVKKYMPHIRSNKNTNTLESQAKTIIAKWLCSSVVGSKNYKQYRILKSSGTAHDWQKLISVKRFDLIDFSKIPGRALSKLVRSKFLKNQKLEDKYKEFVTAPETKTIKYTGFVHELFEGINPYVQTDVIQRETINKQFAELVKKGGSQNQTNFIVVRDTSGSMGSIASGTKSSCYNIAKALALYFSEFLVGQFANNWIEFNTSAKMHTWTGTTPVDKYMNDRSGFVGSTNFQSVIDLFCTLKAQGIDEEHFPTGILCISDSEFNPASMNMTNREAALIKLKNAGFSDEYVENFVIVLWNLQSSYYGGTTGQKFESQADTPNCFYFSGYSAAVVSFLTNKISTPIELVNKALDQDILKKITI